MPGYQKAYVCPYINKRPDLENRFYVPFNPSEITIEEAIGIKSRPERKPGRKRDKTGEEQQKAVYQSRRFTEENKVVLSVRLFFNTLNDLYQTSYEDVREYISQLYRYTNATLDVSMKAEEIYFFWGSIAVAGILNRMNVHYTMFAPDGKPVRAEVDISIVGDYVGDYAEYKPALAPQTTGTGTYGHLKEVTGFSELMNASTTWRSNARGGINPRL